MAEVAEVELFALTACCVVRADAGALWPTPMSPVVVVAGCDVTPVGACAESDGEVEDLIALGVDERWPRRLDARCRFDPAGC